MRTKAASALQVFANHPSPPGGAHGASACQTTRTVRKGHHPYRKDVTLHRSETRTGRTLVAILLDLTKLTKREAVSPLQHSRHVTSLAQL